MLAGPAKVGANVLPAHAAHASAMACMCHVCKADTSQHLCTHSMNRCGTLRGGTRAQCRRHKCGANRTVQPCGSRRQRGRSCHALSTAPAWAGGSIKQPFQVVARTVAARRQRLVSKKQQGSFICRGQKHPYRIRKATHTITRAAARTCGLPSTTVVGCAPWPGQQARAVTCGTNS